MAPTPSTHGQPAGGPPRSEAPALQARLAPVLAGLGFPARRWQVVAEADLYGCDGVTRALVDRLPERAYASLGDLVGVLAAVLAGRAVPPPVVPGLPAGRAPLPPVRARRSGTPAAGVSAPGTGAPGSLAARHRPRRTPGPPTSPTTPTSAA